VAARADVSDGFYDHSAEYRRVKVRPACIAESAVVHSRRHALTKSSRPPDRFTAPRSTFKPIRPSRFQGLRRA
jgi:hypothetical protein